MTVFLRVLLCGIVWTASAADLHAESLPALRATLAETSVSGVSAGGYMAVQFGVAHSAIVRGVGAIAAGPYYCAGGNVVFAMTACSTGPVAVVALSAIARDWATAGLIDPIEGIAHQRVWLFSGTRDNTVKSAVVHELAAFYEEFLPKKSIRGVFHIAASHAFVTDGNGSACGNADDKYLENCRFDSAGEILGQIYGDLKPRAASVAGKLVKFEQKAFVPAGRPSGLAEHGYVFIPADCAALKPCRMHVALHGCLQDAAHVGDAFVAEAGYNLWADTNSIIVLYPQVAASDVLPVNPLACWDWWGYTGPDYAQRTAPQIQAIFAMLQRLAGKAAGK